MKAMGFIVLGFGIAWTFFAFLFFLLEEYSGTQVSLLYILPGLILGFLGLICLKGRI